MDISNGEVAYLIHGGNRKLHILYLVYSKHLTYCTPFESYNNLMRINIIIISFYR